MVQTPAPSTTFFLMGINTLETEKYIYLERGLYILGKILGQEFSLLTEQTVHSSHESARFKFPLQKKFKYDTGKIFGM